MLRRAPKWGLAGVVFAFSISLAHAWNPGSADFGAHWGTFDEGVVCDPAKAEYWAKATFEFSAEAIAVIDDYNDGGENPGSGCDSTKAYLTVDISAVGDGWTGELDAASMAFVDTNLPSPLIDLDDDDWDGKHERAQVTVQGALVPEKSYYVTVHFDDYRNGDAKDGGTLEVHLDMSKLVVTEYGVCHPGGGPQVVDRYGESRCDT